MRANFFASTTLKSESGSSHAASNKSNVTSVEHGKQLQSAHDCSLLQIVEKSLHEHKPARLLCVKSSTCELANEGLCGEVHRDKGDPDWLGTWMDVHATASLASCVVAMSTSKNHDSGLNPR